MYVPSIELELEGENYPSAERNMSTLMFKIIRSNKPEIQIWQIFNLYSENKHMKNVV